MAWKVEISDDAQRDLDMLDKSVKKKLVAFIDRLPLYPSPRSIGKALNGEWSGRWRYRFGDYRIICRIQDDVLIIEVVKIGHRREVYRSRK